MALRVNSVTFDADDPGALARFWAEAFHVDPPAPDNPFMARFSLDGGPDLMFIKVPEPKTAKNRCHLDLHADDQADVDAEVARLKALGATLIREPQEEYGVYWATLHDPEGNEFCIGAARER